MTKQEVNSDGYDDADGTADDDDVADNFRHLGHDAVHAAYVYVYVTALVLDETRVGAAAVAGRAHRRVYDACHYICCFCFCYFHQYENVHVHDQVH